MTPIPYYQNLLFSVARGEETVARTRARCSKLYGVVHCPARWPPALLVYAQYKVWLKPSAELSFLYGNHCNKAGLGRCASQSQSYLRGKKKRPTFQSN